VVLEAHNRNWLFALETAATLPDRARYSADGQLLARSPVRARMRYDLVSVIAPEGLGSDEEPATLRRALRRPPGFNARTVALAEKLRAASSSDGEVMTRAIGLLRQGGYAYTLEPPLLGADRWMNSCSRPRPASASTFSSAFVFMMRAAGIRPGVTGYQGGELNPVDQIITCGNPTPTPGRRCS